MNKLNIFLLVLILLLSAIVLWRLQSCCKSESYCGGCGPCGTNTTGNYYPTFFCPYSVNPYWVLTRPVADLYIRVSESFQINNYNTNYSDPNGPFKTTDFTLQYESNAPMLVVHLLLQKIGQNGWGNVMVDDKPSSLLWKWMGSHIVIVNSKKTSQVVYIMMQCQNYNNQNNPYPHLQLT